MESSTLGWMLISFGLFMLTMRLVSARNGMANEVEELRNQMKMLERTQHDYRSDLDSDRQPGVVLAWLVVLLMVTLVIVLYNLGYL